MAALSELTREERSALLKSTLSVAARVARDGGTGEVTIPDPETDELTAVEIDQTQARKLLSWCNDSLAISLWEQIRNHRPLTPRDREFLCRWTDATIADDAASERERQITSAIRRSQFHLVDGDQP